MPVEPHLPALQLSTARERLDAVFRSLQELDLDLGADVFDQEKVRSGVGGFSDVYRASSKRHKKLVAVKCIRICLLEDESTAKALEREFRLWSKLKHPNVLPLLGFYLEGANAIPNLISEWMERGTVTTYIKNRPYNVAELFHMVHGIASGLCYLHFEMDIVHSDLKGSNILVSNDGLPLLADFGISISYVSSSLAGTTMNRDWGSPRWMAKEFFLSDVLPSTETDMWAFGMVICELLTRNLPFHGIAERRVATVILEGVLPNLTDFDFDPYGCDDRQPIYTLCSIAHSCWNEKNSERPSAKDVLDILDAWQTKLARTLGDDIGVPEASEGQLSDLAPFLSVKKQRIDDFEPLKDLDLKDDLYGRDSEYCDWGSTSDVYKSWSRKHGKRVAIKRIRVPLVENTSFSDSVTKVIRKWSKLNHRNILRLLGFFLEGEKVVLNVVSEWMEKGCLEYYNKLGFIEGEKEICKIVDGIASGLIYLHGKLVVHSDIKSRNILISNDNRPLLADFGLSVSLASLYRAGTITRVRMASYRWTARELFRQSNVHHCQETDIWAFGMVIFELLSREFPFENIHEYLLPQCISNGLLPRQPEPNYIKDRDIYEALWSICTDCWLYNPSERPDAWDAYRRSQHLLKITIEPPSVVDFRYPLLQAEGRFAYASDIFVVSKGTYLSRAVVVKRTIMPIIKSDSTGDFKFVEKEIRKWRSACERDPDECYILKLIGFAIHEDYLIMVSDWKEHHDLLTYMTRSINAEYVNHKFIIRWIAKGLKMLHEQEPPIIHGNIRASNIMVNDKGNPLLGGFGIFKFHEKMVGRSIASAHEVANDSLRWLAPELLTANEDEDESDSDDSASIDTDSDVSDDTYCDRTEEVDRMSKAELHSMQSDVYSLGMTILEILTGEKPFGNDSSLVVRLKVKAGERPKRPKKRSAAFKNGLDDKLWSLLTRCWAQEPIDRPDIFQINKELDEMWPDVKISEEIPQAIAEKPVEAPVEVPVDAAIEASAEAPV